MILPKFFFMALKLPQWSDWIKPVSCLWSLSHVLYVLLYIKAPVSLSPFHIALSDQSNLYLFHSVLVFKPQPPPAAEIWKLCPSENCTLNLIELWSLRQLGSFWIIEGCTWRRDTGREWELKRARHRGLNIWLWLYDNETEPFKTRAFIAPTWTPNGEFVNISDVLSQTLAKLLTWILLDFIWIRKS